jgi:hypothetical protein
VKQHGNTTADDPGPFFTKLTKCDVCHSFLQNSSTQVISSSDFERSTEEDAAVDKLMTRLNLIQLEQGWSRPSVARNFLGNNSDPW